MGIPAGPGPGSGRADGSLTGSLPPFGQRSLARRPVWPEGRWCRRVRRFDLMPGISGGREACPYSSGAAYRFSFPAGNTPIFGIRAAVRLASGGHPRTGQRLLFWVKAPSPRFHSLSLVRSVSLTLNPRGVGYASVPPSRIWTSQTHEGDCRSGQTLRAPVARGMVLRHQRQEPTPCPRRMPPLTPPALPPR
jgi:hypothetical protein